MHRHATHVATLLALLLMHGCGSDDGSGSTTLSGRAGSATEPPPYDPGEVQIDPPTPPDLPDCLSGDEPEGCAQPPQLTDWTCPDGWISETIGSGLPWEHSICDVSAPPTCPAGSAAFLTESQCHPLGSTCPQDFLDESALRAWAPNHAGSIWYVAPGGQGNGTRQDPFGTIASAIAAAQTGDIIALALGTYDERLEIDTGVALVGACVEQTVVSPSSVPTDEASIELFAAGARVANLRVSGPEAGLFAILSFGEVSLDSVEVAGASHVGIAQTDGGTLRLKDVVVRDTGPRLIEDDLGVGLATLAGDIIADRVLVERNRTMGVLVTGSSASLDARELVVLDTQSQLVDGAWGDALAAEDGAIVSAERVLCDGNADAAVSAIEASVRLVDAVLRDTDVRSGDQLWGLSLYAENGEIEAERVRMSESRSGGVWALGPSSRVTLTDTHVANSLGIPPDDNLGHGIHFEAGAFGQLTRVTSEANRGVGVASLDTGTRVEASDVVVTGTVANPREGGIGLGLYAVGGDTVVRRGWFEGNTGAGFGCQGASVADAEDLMVTDTLPLVNSLYGEGINAELGCNLTVKRAVLRRNSEVGVSIVNDGTTAVLEDILITDTRPRPYSDLWGMGLESIYGADVRASRVVSIRNRYAGVSVSGANAKLAIEDVAVRDTYSGDADLFYGIGLEAYDGATLDASRVDIEASRAVGVLAESSDTIATISDLRVFDTRRGDCATTPAQGNWCEDPANDPNNAGAIVAWEGADMQVLRFDLERSRCGIILARDARLELDHGHVHDHAIGLNLRVPDYDASLVMGPRVRYTDNGTNLDAVELVLPEIPTKELPESED